MTFDRRSFLPLLALALTTRAAWAAELDVPYEPSPPAVVEAMLRIGEVKPDDLVYDLGSGDGRIVIAAVRDFGVKSAVGVDLDPQRIAEANANARRERVTDRARFIQGDLFKTDFSAATLVTLYLWPEVNIRLRPTILAMKPGTRIVSHSHDMDEWVADRHEVVRGKNIYFWRVPAKVAGRWTWRVGDDVYTAELSQEFQKVRGTLSAHGERVPLENVVLDGAALRFEAKPRRNGTIEPIIFTASMGPNVVDAQVTVAGQPVSVRAERN